MKCNHKCSACLLIAAMVLAGCQSRKKPRMSASQPSLQSAMMNDVHQRMSELRARAAVFTAAAKALPGDDSVTDRKLTTGAFDAAASALTLLGGPQPNGGFRQNLRIIDNCRQRIGASLPEMSVDPTTDTGLRAIYNALINMQEQFFPVDRQVHSQLDIVRDRVDALDAVRGPLHSVTAAECFVAQSDLVNMMSEKLEGRAVSPATAPATAPALAPTAASSTTQP